MISHQTLRRLVYFAAIADAGSIRGAAKRLNLSVPVLSEALSELEAELGVSLATRTTRRFVLSEAGIRTQAAAQHIVDTAQGLTDLTAPNAPLSGKLGITIPVELAEFWLPQKVNSFHSLHPDVMFDIDVTDSLIDLRSSEIEIAIRTDYINPGEKSRTGINLPLILVASSSVFIDSNGCVDLPLIDSKVDRQLVATSRLKGNVQPITFAQTHRITNRSAGLQMARAGFGAIMVMRGSVENDLATGSLAETFPEFDFGSIDLECHFRDRLPSRTAQVFAHEVGLNVL